MTLDLGKVTQIRIAFTRKIVRVQMIGVKTIQIMNRHSNCQYKLKFKQSIGEGHLKEHVEEEEDLLDEVEVADGDKVVADLLLFMVI